MAHSFIEAQDDETAAFEIFARARPDNVVLLLDTYDTEAAARKVVALAPRLKASGIAIRGVRLDSGDLVALAKSVRAILDAGGLQDVTIFASGGLDEDALADLLRAKAPVDGFGVGTSLTTSSDVPAIDFVYKLQEYSGGARRKKSDKKATWPGRKQVWRRYDADGRMAGDRIALTVPLLGHYISALYELSASGPYAVPAAQPIDLERRAQVNTAALSFVRVDSVEAQRRKLRAGRTLVNYGILASYRRQDLDAPAWTQPGGLVRSYTYIDRQLYICYVGNLDGGRCESDCTACAVSRSICCAVPGSKFLDQFTSPLGTASASKASVP